MATTARLMAAGLPALPASLLGQNVNGEGAIPASEPTAGYAITSNYGGFGEVDLWNLVNNEDTNQQGWYFHQKTGAATESLVAYILTYSGSSSFSVIAPNSTTAGTIFVSNTEIDIGTDQVIPITFFNGGVTRLILGADGRVILPISITPASAIAAGVAGTIAWDASFIYVCVSTNAWKRVAIATW